MTPNEKPSLVAALTQDVADILAAGKLIISAAITKRAELQIKHQYLINAAPMFSEDRIEIYGVVFHTIDSPEIGWGMRVE